MRAEPETRPPETAARSNLLLLSVRALVASLRGSILSVILQPFVLALGAPVAYIGWLESIGGYRGLVPTLVLPAAGWLADRLGRKLMLVVASLFATLSLLLITVSSLERNAALLTPALVLFGLSAIGRPATDALVVESVRREEVGYAYGKFSLAAAAASVIASLAGGYAADMLGFTSTWAGIAVLELLAVLVLIFGVQETLAARRRPRLPIREVPHLAVRLLLPPPALRWLYAAIVIDTFAYGIGGTLLYGFLADRYGFTPSQFGIMNAAYSIAWMASQLPAGRLADRGLTRELLIAAELLNTLIVAIWLVTSRFEVFVATMVLFGIVAALWSPALMAWVNDRILPERRAEEFGRLSGAPGVFAFPAPFLGGLLYERLGFAVPIALNLVGLVIADIILVWGMPRER